eukprot:TRINITY_DN4628_c0_g6_i1.p1 TRINITY_DN4628_c0_g6~~TRINITY_DN4628_c0_g6_i1.p1  ORF type:complete len:160 (+),score=18.90 TRINITY_DN4628_c0_g6_i1:60-482(+)
MEHEREVRRMMELFQEGVELTSLSPEKKGDEDVGELCAVESSDSFESLEERQLPPKSSLFQPRDVDDWLGGWTIVNEEATGRSIGTPSPTPAPLTTIHPNRQRRPRQKPKPKKVNLISLDIPSRHPTRTALYTPGRLPFK